MHSFQEMLSDTLKTGCRRLHYWTSKLPVCFQRMNFPAITLHISSMVVDMVIAVLGNTGPGHPVCMYIIMLTKFGTQGTVCGEFIFMLCWMLNLTSWINTCMYKIHIWKWCLYQKVLNFIAAMVIIEFSNPILLKNMQDLEFTWLQDNTY